MRVADRVEMLEIPANIMGSSSIIHPTLIWDNNTVILFDSGFPGQMIQIREEIEKAGLSLDKLNMVILTHHDIDHIGSLSDILKETRNKVKVLAHVEEKPYIDGEKCPIKVAKLEANLNSLPENMKLIYEKLKEGFQNSRVNVDRTLTDGEELPYCGGIKVIHTPGHTIGHICLYLKESKVLIAGDALSIKDGKLVRSSEAIDFDPAQSAASIRKLAQYDIDMVVCYHGGLYKDNVNQSIAWLANI